MKKSTNIANAISAIDEALNRFDMPTSAMAVSAVAGVYAAQGVSALRRFAGIGANIETMMTAFTETIQFNSTRKKRSTKRRPQINR